MHKGWKHLFWNTLSIPPHVELCWSLLSSSPHADSICSNGLVHINYWSMRDQANQLTMGTTSFTEEHFIKQPSAVLQSYCLLTKMLIL